MGRGGDPKDGETTIVIDAEYEKTIPGGLKAYSEDEEAGVATMGAQAWQDGGDPEAGVQTMGVPGYDGPDAARFPTAAHVQARIAAAEAQRAPTPDGPAPGARAQKILLIIGGLALLTAAAAGGYLLVRDRGGAPQASAPQAEAAAHATSAEGDEPQAGGEDLSLTHLRAHETGRNLVCRLLLEKKKKNKVQIKYT